MFKVFLYGTYIVGYHYTSDIKVKMIDCSFATIEAPAVLPNTGALDYLDMVMPSTTYEILDQF